MERVTEKGIIREQGWETLYIPMQRIGRFVSKCLDVMENVPGGNAPACGSAQKQLDNCWADLGKTR